MKDLEVIECGGCAPPVLTERQADQRLVEALRERKLAATIPFLPASPAREPRSGFDRVLMNAVWFLLGVHGGGVAAGVAGVSLRCALGMHRWIPRARAITPRREVARFQFVGHLFQHPSTWPSVWIPYTKRFEKVGEQCKRCGARRSIVPTLSLRDR